MELLESFKLELLSSASAMAQGCYAATPSGALDCFSSPSDWEMLPGQKNFSVCDFGIGTSALFEGSQPSP